MQEKIIKLLKRDKFYILTILAIVVLFNIELPYYVSAPGGTIDIKERIKYEQQVEQKGSLNLLYVTEYVASIPFYLLSYLIEDWDLESIKPSQLSSEETVDEINIRNKIMLENSINSAMYVAYKQADKKIEITNKKYVVIGTTLENGLKIGDEILDINEQKISSLQDIKEHIEKNDVGDKLKIKVLRNNKEKIVSSKVKKIEDNKALGVIIVTNYKMTTEPEIEINFKPSESGASGGLMMALSIYNAISEKDLLKGRNIAGTGTIDMEGNVGEIAGIKYKIMGAAKNKMDIVLVPSANYKEALKVKKEKKYSLKIIEVKTFQDAIKYLQKSS